MIAHPLRDTAELEQFLETRAMCILYFTGPACAVCKVLKPKLMEMLEQLFPEIAFGEVDCAEAPALSARYGIFTIPAVIVFTLGKEQLRKSRSFGVSELVSELERPYTLLFR